MRSLPRRGKIIAGPLQIFGGGQEMSYKNKGDETLFLLMSDGDFSSTGIVVFN